MNTILSKELRWFFDDNRAKPIQDWFAHLTPPQKFHSSGAGIRHDYYLKMYKVNNLGVKVREPKKDPSTGKHTTAFEIKQRISDNNYIALPNNNKAYTNIWQKISHEIVEGAGGILSINFSFPISDKEWVRLEKDRMLIQFDGETKALSTQSDLNEACGIELTKVRVAGKLFYSFGLEAYSESGKYLDDNFNECCEFVFNTIGIKDLKLMESLSYPEFLSTL